MARTLESVLERAESQGWIMDRVRWSEVRRSLKAACDRVCERHEPLLIERRAGGDVVLMAKDDYPSLDETAYLLSTPENARRLLAALSGRPEERKRFSSIDELKDEVGA
jgi:antitoxin YefM